MPGKKCSKKSSPKNWWVVHGDEFDGIESLKKITNKNKSK